MNTVYDNVLQLKEDIPPGKKTVFTNGCFDILHPGHLHILRKASELGDILVVGLNSDSSVRKLKGSGRPVMKESARAEILSSLKMVDYVLLFSEPTPREILEILRPDVLVKGSEYEEEEIAGRELAGKIVRIKMLPGYSTTLIIKKLTALNGK